MIGRFETVAERARSAAAMLALIYGDEPEDDGPVRVCCPYCHGTGEYGVFGGHGLAAYVYECGPCEGSGEIRESDL